MGLHDAAEHGLVHGKDLRVPAAHTHPPPKKKNYEDDYWEPQAHMKGCMGQLYGGLELP